MTMIYVRAMPGRIAYATPNRGKPIPHGEFIPVADTPYVRRLAEVHKDIEIRKEPEKKAAAKKEKEPDVEAHAAPPPPPKSA